MKNLLFPRQFQFVGWLLFIPAAIVGMLLYFSFCNFHGVTEIVVNDAVIIGIALEALFIVCSKERHEDEMTRAIRLASLLNTMYMYVVILIASTLLLNGVAYFQFMILNLVLLPVIFVIIFRLELQHYNKMSDDEERE